MGEEIYFRKIKFILSVIIMIIFFQNIFQRSFNNLKKFLHLEISQKKNKKKIIKNNQKFENLTPHSLIRTKKNFQNRKTQQARLAQTP